MNDVIETQVKETVIDDETIPNWMFHGTNHMLIDIEKITFTKDDETHVIYNPMITFFLDHGQESGHQVVTIITNVLHECPKTAASMASESLSGLFNYDNIWHEVTIYEDGKEISSFELDEDDEEYDEPTTEEHITNIKKVIAGLTERLAEFEAQLES
jgi:hypothetical protein